MNGTANKVIAAICATILLADQATKWIILHWLPPNEEHVVIDGFFRFVLWSNTGAAWSLFQDNNDLLAGVSVIALVVLYLLRHHFEAHRLGGQVALGLIFGGILGNLTDRLLHNHVIDFLYFYVDRRGGSEIGFPAFNIADSAICTGVALIFLLTWQQETAEASS